LRIGFGFSTFCHDAGAVHATSLGPFGAAATGEALGGAAGFSAAVAGGDDPLGSGVLLQEFESIAMTESALQAPANPRTDRPIILSTLPFC
jgi:hypothetical protein